jgi:NDP-mannose synthase
MAAGAVNVGNTPCRRPTRGLQKKAVVLAGGRGSRLAPYTIVLPKPLLPIGDHAILEVVVNQLRATGFGDVTFAVGYLAHLIRAVFQDGAAHGVDITYHLETEARGTAGAIGSIDGLDDTFLVMNGDVLTTLDFSELDDAHRASGNAMTTATHHRVIRSEYGVLDLAGDQGPARVVGYREKPEFACVVSMGIYMLEPRVREYIGHDEYIDVPDLVLRLLAAGETIGSHLYSGLWLDIGRPDDYLRATEEYQKLTMSGTDITAREPRPQHARR